MLTSAVCEKVGPLALHFSTPFPNFLAFLLRRIRRDPRVGQVSDAKDQKNPELAARSAEGQSLSGSLSVVAARASIASATSVLASA